MIFIFPEKEAETTKVIKKNRMKGSLKVQKERRRKK
jgi:hypothetical protein